MTVDIPTRAATAVDALSFYALRKRFGNKMALDGFSLHVEAGETFALVGANGAGKTTCIRALLDFTALDSGSIAIFGVPHARTKARARLVFLPERFNPPHYLRGMEFVRYVLSLHGTRFSAAAVVSMARDLDLDGDALSRPLRSYSKGMAQKLGLAACFLCDSDLMVLDEPMSGLDPKARLLVKVQLKLLRETGRSLFFSTHLLADVEELCDRVGVIHEGRVRFEGSPAELRRLHGDTEDRPLTLEQAYMRCISTV